MTKLEKRLYIWTSLNYILGIGLLLFGRVHTYGKGITVFEPFLFISIAGALLLWRLTHPNRKNLIAGAVYWGIQILSIRFEDRAYGIQLGISFNFKPINSAHEVVTINLIAIITMLLYMLAAKKRIMKLPQAINDA